MTEMMKSVVKNFKRAIIYMFTHERQVLSQCRDILKVTKNAIQKSGAEKKIHHLKYVHGT